MVLVRLRRAVTGKGVLAHLLKVASSVPSPWDGSTTVCSPSKTTFAAAALNRLSYLFLLWVIVNTSHS